LATRCSPTLGLGAILRASEWLFVVLKLVGAAYLIYLGSCCCARARADLALGANQSAFARAVVPGWRVFQPLQPKIAIFYFAFLPQFVAADSAHPTLQLLALGLVFAALTFLVKGRSAFLPAPCRAGCGAARACCSGSIARAAWYLSAWACASPSNGGQLTRYAPQAPTAVPPTPSPVRARRTADRPACRRSSRVRLHVEVPVAAQVEQNGAAFPSSRHRTASSIAL